ncbi:MAG: hypothetical protein IV111_00850, partial [Pseudomonas sp.]|nr:hypothetical protein [Pseudomonas sp.]
MSNLLEQQALLLESVDQSAQARRLNQIANVLSVVLVVMGIQAVLSQSNWNALMVVLAMLALLVGARMNKRGWTDSAIFLVLGSMTTVVTVSLWLSQGLYSGALLCYPVILIVAGMVSRLRLFVGLLLFMLAAVAVMAWGAMSGWHVPVPVPIGVERMVNVSCVLLVCACAVWILANDLRQT